MQIDPVTLEIIWSRLIGICKEAETALQRTSFSLLVRESHDLCCVMTDAKGDAVAMGWGRLPSIAVAVQLAVKNILKKYPPEMLDPEDILITNDPWLTTGHLWDVVVVEPIFYKGTLIGFGSSVAHWPDIGGKEFSAENRSLFEEGLQLPILKIAKRGQINEEVVAIIRQNVRLPDEVIGDFTAMTVANSLMRARLIELLDREGIADFSALAEIILGRSEAAMRKIIDRIPDGDYDNQLQIEAFDRTLTIKVKVTVHGSDLNVDFAGSSEQVPWAINAPPVYSYAQTFFPIKSALDPHLPDNAGPRQPVTVSLPLGSIVNPRQTVGTAARHFVGIYLAVAVLGALSKTTPELAQAESVPLWSYVATGLSESGKQFVAISNISGGLGSRNGKDGISCSYFPASVKCLPIEVLENHNPRLVIGKKQIRTDSGGPGKYRGGCGQEMELLLRGEGPVTFSPSAGGLNAAAPGAFGGEPGATGSLLLNGSPINGLRPTKLGAGDLVSLGTPGGGGFGDPFARDPSRVLADVAGGFVSPEQAESRYGVKIDLATMSLDAAATALRRGAGQPVQQPSANRAQGGK